jgi:copper/silver efflux system protein
MIDRVIEASARRRGVVVAGVVAALAVAFVAMSRVELDALPDLADPQVIVAAEWMGQAPEAVESRVAVPLASALATVPGVRTVRSTSMNGMTFVHVLFDEGTFPERARDAVGAALTTVSALPSGVSPRLGPDASSVGWVFQYVLHDASGARSLPELRGLQDALLRPALAGVPGVAEVASVGGHGETYDVVVDPLRLEARGLTVTDLQRALLALAPDLGGRELDVGGRELIVRGRLPVIDAALIEQLVVASADATSAAVQLNEVATVRVGEPSRRGVLDWNGEGEAVGGIVVMRDGENALTVIESVRAELASLGTALPAGVTVEVAYDRSRLVRGAIATLTRALVEEVVVIALVVLVFLMHLRSALLPALSLPITVALAFVPMWLFGVPSTIMSLGGIAIALGSCVDAELVMLEAAHKRLERAPPGADRRSLLAASAKEVTPAVVVSLLILAAAFLPVLTLSGEAGRLFRPLALTKTFVMLAAAALSVTLAPALRSFILRGHIRSESDNRLSRLVLRFYRPFVAVALARPRTTLLIGVFAVLSAIPLYRALGHEFMPALDEGDLLYMPTTLPGVSLSEARQHLIAQDQALRAVPEVASVFGKVGRAESATDPAPLNMIETTVRLVPESRWRPGLTRERLRAELEEAGRFPGYSPAWTMPIRGRVDMLATGIRGAVGVKVLGRNRESVEAGGLAVERILAVVPGTRRASLERSAGQTFVDVVPDPTALARFGLTPRDVMHSVEAALGAMPVRVRSEKGTVDVVLRYPDSVRNDPDKLRRLRITAPAGAVAHEDGMPAAGPRSPVFLGQVAAVDLAAGAAMVRGENGLQAGYVHVDVDPARDLGGYVGDAERALAVANGELQLPPGVFVEMSGDYEELAATRGRLKFIVPLTLLLIFALLAWHKRSGVEALIILLAVPFALTGSVWLLWLLDYRLSAAVWVGMLALVGLAAQTGVVMVLYIDNAYERRKAEGRIRTREDILAAHLEGTVLRVRPKLMTVGAMLLGLLPLLFASGPGADVMKRIAAPMIGGLASSAFLTLELLPVVYTYWRVEQLLFASLAERDALAVVRLRRWALAHAWSWAGLVVAMLSPVYLELTGGFAVVSIGLGAVATVATAVRYLLLRARLSRGPRALAPPAMASA